jgi:hypothetical protein
MSRKIEERNSKARRAIKANADAYDNYRRRIKKYLKLRT